MVYLINLKLLESLNQEYIQLPQMPMNLKNMRKIRDQGIIIEEEFQSKKRNYWIYRWRRNAIMIMMD